MTPWTRIGLAVCINDTMNKDRSSNVYQSCHEQGYAYQSVSMTPWTRTGLAVCINDTMNKDRSSNVYQWRHEQGYAYQSVSMTPWTRICLAVCIKDAVNKVMPGSLFEYQWHHEQAWQMYLPLPPHPTTTVQTTHLHKHACKCPYLEHLQWYTHKVLQNKTKTKNQHWF